jgi:hypothetical protein
MADETEQTILESFRSLAPKPENSGRDLNTLSAITSVMSDVVMKPVGTSGGLGSVWNAIRAGAGLTGQIANLTGHDGKAQTGNALGAVVKTGLGMVPLISGLFHLFGGGSAEEAAPLPRYVQPSPIELEQAAWGADVGESGYDQTGMPRLLPAIERTPVAASSVEATTGTVAGESGRSAVQPVINIQVQAMDSQSFLDRSHDIARAVRDAMLNLNPINDVINDL